MKQTLRKLRHKALPALYLSLVLALTHGVYRQVKDFDMLVYDDLEHIVYNPAINTPGGDLKWDLIWSKPYFDLYVPVAYTMWSLVVDQSTPPAQRQVDPLTLATNRSLATALHTTNLLLHEISTALVFVLLMMLGASASGALVGALLFALHPLQVESVAWISEGRGLLATALGLASLTLWLRSMQRLGRLPNLRHRGTPYVRWVGVGVAWCLFVASVLAKPSTVILPAMAMLAAVIATTAPWRRICVHLVPWILTGLGISTMTRLLQKVLLPSWPWWERGLLAMDSFGFYLRQLIWPTILLPDYGRQPVFDAGYSATLVVTAVFILGLVTFVTKKTRSLNIFIPMLLFAMALSPQLGLFPSFYQSVSTVADRYTYLALLGPAYGMAQAWSWARHAQNTIVKLCLPLASVLWLGMLTTKTMHQLPLWQSTERLFEYNTTHNPESFTAHHGLGDLAMIRKDAKKAANYYQQAIKVRPLFAQGYASLGHALLEDKKPDEAKVALTRAVALNDQNPSALLNLGVSQQRTGDLAGAIDTYRAVNALTPHPLAYYNLAAIYLQRGDLDSAESAFLSALSLNPRLYQAHLKLAVIYQQKGNSQEQHRHLNEAALIQQNQ